jgi:hypothetical protein
MGVPEHFNLPWILAIDDGAFEAEGIDIEWVEAFGGTGEMSQALYHGEADMALLLTEGALTSILTGNKSFIHSVYVDSPLVWGVYAGAKSTASTGQLQHAPFVVSRMYSGSHLMGYWYAAEHKRKAVASDFHAVGDIDGAVKALTEQPDRLFLWEKTTTSPYVDRKVFRLVDECVAPWPAFVAVVRNGLDPARLAAVERAIAIVRNYAADLELSEEEGADLVAYMYDIKPKQARQWLDQVRFSRTGKIDLEKLGQAASTLHRLGILEALPSAERLAEICRPDA